MATTITNKITFEFTGTEKDLTLSFNYANPEASAANIKTAGDGIVTNGSIYANPPTALKAAYIVTTTKTSVDIGS